MPSNRTPLAVVALTALGVLASLPACSDDHHEGSTSSGQAQTACEKDTRRDVYVAGLSKKTSALTVEVVEATPAPPAKLMNTLTVKVLDAAGKPLDGASIAATPYMPDHAHGSNVTPVVTPKGGGTYLIEKLYYPMAGLWQVTLTVTPQGGGAPQEVAFNFCLDG